MEDEFERRTEPGAELDPPSRKPPTAVGTAESPGSDPDQPGRALALRREMRRRDWIGQWIDRTLDVVDMFADAARGAFLRATK